MQLTALTGVLLGSVASIVTAMMSILSYRRQADQLAAVDEAQQQRPRVHNISMHTVAGSPTVTMRLTVVPAAPRVFRV